MSDEFEIAGFYRALAEAYLSGMYSLEALEKRFMECDPAFEPEEGSEEDPLKFFFLANDIHLERLTEEEREFLEKTYEHFSKSREETQNSASDEAEELSDFLLKTVQKVLAPDLKEGSEYEFFREPFGRGVLPGNAIVFLFHDKPVFTGSEETDKEILRKKEEIFKNVKEQMENRIAEYSDVPFYMLRIE